MTELSKKHMKCDNLSPLSEHWGFISLTQQLFVCRCAFWNHIETDCTLLDLWAIDEILSYTYYMLINNTPFIQCESILSIVTSICWNTLTTYTSVSQVVFSRHCSPCDIKELLCTSSNIPRYFVLFLTLFIYFFTYRWPHSLTVILRILENIL